MKKARFKPQVSRVKLDPEQAVLLCDCYNSGERWMLTTPGTGADPVPGPGLCWGTGKGVTRGSGGPGDYTNVGSAASS